MEQLSEALEQFFEAAAEQLRQALENGEMPSIDPNDLALGQQDLQEMSWNWWPGRRPWVQWFYFRLSWWSSSPSSISG